MDAPANHILSDESEQVADFCAANDADRRLHARHVKVMRVARLSGDELEADGLGMVRDISTGGMMIDAHFSLEIGQTVTIALLDDQELTGEVVWKEGQTIGVQFASAIAVEQVLARPTTKSDGKRTRLPRFAANNDVQIWIDNVNLSARLCDISQRGAKLQCSTKIAMHRNVLIKLGEHRPIRGTAKWRGGEFTGVEFHRLLSVDELAQWLKIG
jgi:hypothetical protein